MFRTDGQSDHYRAFATMWRVPDNLLHFLFLNINARFGSDYFVLISQHNFGGKLLYSHSPPPYLPRGEKWLYSHFSGGKIYYIAIFPPIQVRGKYGYIAIFPVPTKYHWNISFQKKNVIEICCQKCQKCNTICVTTFFYWISRVCQKKNIYTSILDIMKL